MKCFDFVSRVALSFAAAGLLATACFNQISGDGDATLRIFFDGCATRAASEESIPDTDSFILSVTGSDGNIVYSGRFCDSPEEIVVKPGAYTVSAVSRVLDGPAYESPVYGDEKVVVAGAGEQVAVALNCSQTNCGVKLTVEQGFRTAFPSGSLYISDLNGSLMHSYDETRTGYVQPGEVSITLKDGGSSRLLLRRKMEAKQMLTLSLSATADAVGSGSDGISIAVDTTRNWLSDRYVVGGENNGEAAESALSVSEAREAAASGAFAGKKVWVCGYIAGCATSSSKIEFNEPFSKSTNIVIGDRSVTSDRDWCLAVELPAGSVREALALPEHPWLHGQKVYLYGIISPSYFGLPAIKSVSEYKLQ